MDCALRYRPAGSGDCAPPPAATQASLSAAASPHNQPGALFAPAGYDVFVRNAPCPRIVSLADACLNFRAKPGVMLAIVTLPLDEIPHEFAHELGRGPVRGRRLGHELIAQFRFQFERKHRLFGHGRPRRYTRYIPMAWWTLQAPMGNVDTVGAKVRFTMDRDRGYDIYQCI